MEFNIAWFAFKFLFIFVTTTAAILTVNFIVVKLRLTTCWKASKHQYIHPKPGSVYDEKFLSGTLAVPYEEPVKKPRKPRAKKVHDVTIDYLNAGLSETDHLGEMYHQDLEDTCETQYWKFPSGVGFRHATLDIPGGWKQCTLTPDGKKVLSVVQFNEVVENE